MESFRRVHVSYACSGKTLGIVWKKPEHEWTTFVSALHYYAARKIGIPIWCVDLLWKYDPWDEAQLPMNVHVKYNIRSVFLEIAESTASGGRCSNCWEDCDDAKDAYERRRKNGVIFSARMRDFYDASCEDCNARFLCDLCRVCLPGGRGTCLECFVPTPLDRLDLISQSVWVEDAAAYEARVEDALPSLTKAQRSRWLCVAAPVRL